MRRLVAREDLAVLAGRPAEEREEVEERLGDDAHLAVLLGRGRAGALREPLLVAAEDQRQMRERRHRGAERAEEQHVLRRVREMVVAARDVRDGHVDVVDGDGEVIGRIAVGAEQDEVVDQLALELHVAADEVVKLDRSRRHGEADDVRLVGNARVDVPASPGVAPLFAGALGGGPFGVELFDRAVAAIRLAARDQLLGAFAIPIEPVALVDRTFIPLDAQPLAAT